MKMTQKHIQAKASMDKLCEIKQNKRYAKFTLHDFNPIFKSPTGFDKSPTNAQDWRQIGARSHELQSCSLKYQRHVAI